MKRQGLDDYYALKNFVEDRPGHDRRYAIDASKSLAELGWSPGHTFEGAIAQTVAWYVENDTWRRAIQDEGDARARQGLSSGTKGAAK